MVSFTARLTLLENQKRFLHFEGLLESNPDRLILIAQLYHEEWALEISVAFDRGTNSHPNGSHPKEHRRLFQHHSHFTAPSTPLRQATPR